MSAAALSALPGPDPQPRVTPRLKPDLRAELEHAARQVRMRHLQRLITLGVSNATIAALGRHALWFGVERIVRVGPERYVPAKEGEPGATHLVHPVYEQGVLVDLIAWQTSAPERWLRRTGMGWALNPDDADLIDRYGAPPVLLRASPLDWLRSGAKHLVVLDWTSPKVERLRWHSEICCATEEIAHMLLRRLTAAIRLPDITLPA